MFGSRGEGGRRDTVRRRLRRLVLGIFALLLTAIVVGLIAIQMATGNVTSVSTGYAPATDATSDALTFMLDAETATRGYLLSGDPSYLQPYRQSESQILPSLDHARSLLHSVGDHSLDGAIAAAQQAARRWLDTVAVPIATSTHPSQSAAQEAAAKQLFDAFRERVGVLIDQLRLKRSRLVDQVLAFRGDARLMTGAVALLAFAIATYFALRTANSISRPLDRLWQTVLRLQRGDLTARASVTSGPIEVREVSAAVDRLGEQVQHARAADDAAAALRARVRPLSESLRIGVDPTAMAQSLVVGIGAVFDVDRVTLHTFDDNRAPALTLQWHSPLVDEARNVLAEDDAVMRSLANRLWHTTGLVALNDLTTDEVPAPFVALRDRARRGGVRSALLAAVGEGASAFGLLSLTHTVAPHEWGQTELSLINQLCAELAQSLVQNHVLAQQQALITQLRELDEAKSALVSTVSHELRTPLTSIAGYLELVLDGEAGDLPETAEDMLKIVERNVVRLRTLIEDLLTQSRIEAGRLRVTVTRIDLREVVSDVITALAPIAESNQVTLTADVPAAGALCVEGDLRQLEQALTNLVANAVKFTPEYGGVKVTGWADDGAAVLEVSDTGIGIPAEELPRLFERFFRASNAAAAEIPGTGLGLSIVKEIVQSHQGTLDVESSVGGGTTVSISLPLAAEPAVG